MSNHELRTRKVLNKHAEPWINVLKCSEKTLRHFENIRNIQTGFPRSGMRRVCIQSVEMFHFMELQSIFFYILLHFYSFKLTRKFLTKFLLTDSRFSRNTFTPLGLKSEVPVHALEVINSIKG